MLGFAEQLTPEQGWTLIGVIAVLAGGILKQNRDLVRTLAGFAKQQATSNERLSGIARKADANREDLEERIEEVPTRTFDEFARRNKKESA